MKNFTKVLALVLVVAMALSMVTMASAEFTDGAEITKKAAVDVLSTLGVLKGYEDGSFKPTGDVTRAEMAKMIATILNKGDDVGEIYKGACSFADSASHWAAGYIAYCAQEKIINGKSAAKFDPDGKVTGVEAAKMLLCALGYTPEGAGLTGANWASNTLSYARKDGRNLLDDVDGNMMDNLNRENAAQMLLNALQAIMVEPEGNATTISLGDLGTIATNVNFKDLTKKNKTDFAGKQITPTTGDPYCDWHLVDETFPDLAKGILHDADGRPSTQWTYKGDEVGTYANPLTVKYDKAVAGKVVYSDLGKLKLDNTALKANYFEDGAVVDVISTIVNGKGEADGDAVKMNSTVTGAVDCKAGNHTKFNLITVDEYDTIGDDGAVTEIYYDADNKTLDIVVNHYYYGEIASVVAAKTAGDEITNAAYVTVKIDDGNIHTVAPTLSVGTDSKADGFETNAFTTEDRVNKTKVALTLGRVGNRTTSDKLITSVVKAEVVTGNLSDYAEDTTGVTSVTVGGTAYAKAANGTIDPPTLNSEATLYLDPTGAVLCADVIESGNYAYVLEADVEKGTFDLYVPQAKLLLADGTVVVAEIAKIYTGATNDKGEFFKTNNKIDSAGTLAATGGKVTHVRDNAVDVSLDTGCLTGKVVSYSVNNEGKYVLTTKTVAANQTTKYYDVYTAPSSGDVYTGAANFEGVKINNNTKFVVGVYDSNSGDCNYTIYTGLNTMPNLEVKTGVTPAFAAIADTDNVAKVVFFNNVKLKGVSSANMMVFFRVEEAFNGSYSADSLRKDADYENGYYTVKAIVDGEIKSVKVDAGVTTVTNTLKKSSTDFDGFNFIDVATVDKNGVYTEATVFDSTNPLLEDGKNLIIAIDPAKYAGYSNGVLDASDVPGALESVRAEDSTPVYVFNAKNGSFEKFDLGSVNTFVGSDSTHSDTSVKAGYYVLDAASVHAGTDKVAAVYLVVEE